MVWTPMFLAMAVQAAPVTLAIDDIRFAPLDPRNPNGPQIAVLHGDPATGPSDMLMRFSRGQGVPHVHSSDYRLVVLEGVMTHAQAGEGGGAKPLGPGSYWFQPGEQSHLDGCLSEHCTMFISWSGKRDARRAP
ncbi:DUF4437 domain-containing protein [Caulobacter sp. SL161]|uniref:DUF4437 domain-containing protein n=1 Tax=Caulobacter sp. SL161 TaxID=2995156 RepID=UPI0022742141|nr:DUF4437 domain-containing protein [Caulobacter sp. SL161]MCY1648703.1 DUF4437 domain-containing protein [Caulobacter sp. SL161]